MSQSGSGIVVEPENAASMAEAVVSLYKMTQEERRNVGARGRAHVAEFYDLGVLADKYEKLLLRTLNLPIKNETNEVPVTRSA